MTHISDKECKGSLVCFQRGDGDTSPVPGCTGSGKPGWDYCVDKDDLDDYDDGDDDDGDDDDGDDDGDDDDGDKKELTNANDGNIEDGKLLGRCKGDCDDGTSSRFIHTLLPCAFFLAFEHSPSHFSPT